jgi:hypothetical protein
MKRYTRQLAVVVLTLIATTFAAAQWNSTAPRDGACFFTDANYRGSSFCVNSGDTVSAVPSGFNDRIRSIRVYGGSQVQFYNAANFGGPSASTSSDISDLQRMQMSDDRSRNWSGRISSLQISGRSAGGYGNGNGNGNGNGHWKRGHKRNGDHDRDNDRDRDRNGYNQNSTVSCSSDGRSNRDWCSTNGRINSVRLVSEIGRNTCQLNRTFGISDGRLWTSRGCSGTFEVQ